ncbi:MAG: hypothetical protein ACJA07_001480 [Rhodococcus sp. (in: high G+C Gram-positive bacteria)]|jgi:hypothetical protein
MARKNSKPTNTWAQRASAASVGQNRITPAHPPSHERSTLARAPQVQRTQRPQRRVDIAEALRAASCALSKHRKLCMIAVAVALALAVVLIAAQNWTGSDAATRADVTVTDEADPMAMGTNSDGAGLPCEEIRTPQRTQSSGAGDTDSAVGLIIAYEHAFFDRRDPSAMVAMTSPGPDVASADALAAGIATVDPNTPWCVTVTPEGTPDVYRAEIRFLAADSEVAQWNQTMTVVRRDAADAGSWTITAVRALS